MDVSPTLYENVLKHVYTCLEANHQMIINKVRQRRPKSEAHGSCALHLFSWVSENGVGKVSRGSSEYRRRRIRRKRYRGLLRESTRLLRATYTTSECWFATEPRKQSDIKRRDGDSPSETWDDGQW